MSKKRKISMDEHDIACNGDKNEDEVYVVSATEPPKPVKVKEEPDQADM
jgi:hypothetical protein